MASLLEYLKAAMRRAEYERLEDGTFYAHIPGFEGLWASGPNVEDTRTELLEVLDEWLYVNAFVSQLTVPALGECSLEAPKKIEL